MQSPAEKQQKHTLQSHSSSRDLSSCPWRSWVTNSSSPLGPGSSALLQQPSGAVGKKYFKDARVLLILRSMQDSKALLYWKCYVMLCTKALFTFPGSCSGTTQLSWKVALPPAQNIGTTKCKFLLTPLALKSRKIIGVLIPLLAFLTFDCKASQISFSNTPVRKIVVLFCIKSSYTIFFPKVKHPPPLSMFLTFIGLLTFLLSNNLKLPSNEANYGQYHNGKEYFIWDIWAMCMNRLWSNHQPNPKTSSRKHFLGSLQLLPWAHM